MECVLSSLVCPPPIGSNSRRCIAPSSSHYSSGIGFQRSLLIRDRAPSSTAVLGSFWLLWSAPRFTRGVVVCSGGSDDSRTPPKISSAAKIRSEVISPFRSVRMFFYLAFIASGSIGALISLPRLIAALGHASNAPLVTEVLSGLGIDLVAVLVFVFLYRIEAKSRDKQLAKLSREETLAGLRLELKNNKTITVGKMRGISRLVIVVGPASHIEEACRRSEPFYSGLLERGVLVVPFSTDGQVPKLQFASNGASGLLEGEGEVAQPGKLWKGRPVYTGEWTRWLMEQKQLANVPDDAPVYLSLRLDGRVRGSGMGFPPWGAFVAQLPPLKGIWSGALDGMDGRI